MRDQMIPVFVDEKSASSSQYANTIQGIRTAAARCNMRLRLISDARFDETDFETLPGVAIVTGVSMPFIQKAIARLRSHGRYAVWPVRIPSSLVTTCPAPPHPAARKPSSWLTTYIIAESGASPWWALAAGPSTITFATTPP